MLAFTFATLRRVLAPLLRPAFVAALVYSLVTAMTAVYVTHDQEEALAISDRVIMMNAGRIAQEGTPPDVYERPASQRRHEGRAFRKSARIDPTSSGCSSMIQWAASIQLSLAFGMVFSSFSA